MGREKAGINSFDTTIPGGQYDFSHHYKLKTTKTKETQGGLTRVPKVTQPGFEAGQGGPRASGLTHSALLSFTPIDIQPPVY